MSSSNEMTMDLVITYSNRMAYFKLVRGDFSRLFQTEAAIAEMLSLPNLKVESVEISCTDMATMQWSSMTGSLRKVLSTARSLVETVERLKLINLDGIPVSFFRSYPSLKHLLLVGIRLDRTLEQWYTFDYSSEQRHPPKLDTLSYTSCEDAVNLFIAADDSGAWRRKAVDATQLSELEASAFSQESLIVARNLIGRSFTTLQRLKLLICDDPANPVMFPRDFSLTNLRWLRKLDLELYGFDCSKPHAYHLSSFLGTVVGVFNQISQLNIMVKMNGSLDLEGWSLLDATLMQEPSKWKSLREVVLTFDVPCPLDLPAGWETAGYRLESADSDAMKFMQGIWAQLPRLVQACNRSRDRMVLTLEFPPSAREILDEDLQSQVPPRLLIKDNNVRDLIRRGQISFTP